MRRPDGLVERRPHDVTVVYDDPMYLNYLWVAMLDPVELADGADPGLPPATDAGLPAGAEVLELEETQRLGRPTIAATIRPSQAYNPRCTCCALLFNDVTVAILREEGGPIPDPVPAFADVHRVELDRQTGICLSVRDVGGDRDGAGYDVVIEQVDAAYPDEFFRASG